MSEKTVRIISDSVGETAEQLFMALMMQFPSIDFRVLRFSEINSLEKFDLIVNQIEKDAMVVITVVDKSINQKIKEELNARDIFYLDLLSEPIRQLEEYLNVSSQEKAGLLRELTVSYFDKIAAIEFAVKYDDGKDPRGILEADVVLIGVSRTSKTPLSMYLANKGYKVVNIPLVPEIEAPEELFKISPEKIIGLIISPYKLNDIRIERLKSLGLDVTAEYATDNRIDEELRYAKKLMAKLNCEVIDVSNRSIEDTAGKIIMHLRNLQ